MTIENTGKIKSKSKRNYKLVRVIAGSLVPIVISGTFGACGRRRIRNYNGYNYNVNSYIEDYNSSSSSNSYDYYNSSSSSNTYNYYNSSNFYDTSSVENKYSNSEQSNNVNSSYSIRQYSYEEVEKTLRKEINVNSSNANYLINFIKSNETYYPNSQLFDLNNALNKYYNLSKYNSTFKSIFSNNKITSEQLFNIVLNNNTKEEIKVERKVSESDLRKICNILAAEINDYVANNKVDLNLLSEKIINLKIQNYSEFSNGSYDPNKNTMIFAINKLYKSDEFFKRTVEHEGVHLIQAASDQEQKKLGIEFRFGPCYKLNNLKINSLYWNWFYEGSAESLTMMRNNSRETEIYEEYVKVIDSIKVANIIDSSKELDSFERLSFNKDIESIFEYFNCDTDADKMEVLNMMASFDVVLQSGKISEEFEKMYENSVRDIDGPTSRKIKAELKGSIAQTLSKQFYINLIKGISSKNVSLKEVFTSISIFENEMSRLTWYPNTTETEELKPFIEMYNNIQGEFFQTIGDLIGISVQDLLSQYAIFYNNNIMSANDLNISSNKKNFLEYIIDSRSDNKFSSIYEVSQSKYKMLGSVK